MMGNLSFKKLSIAAVMLTAIGLSGAVIAGEKVVQPVTATTTFILGNLSDARNSTSTMERLEIHDYGTSMYISGVMASGSMGGCTTNNVTAMAQLRAANSDAQVRANISSGTCTNVYVNNSSRNATKNH